MWGVRVGAHGDMHMYARESIRECKRELASVCVCVYVCVCVCVCVCVFVHVRTWKWMKRSVDMRGDNCHRKTDETRFFSRKRPISRKKERHTESVRRNARDSVVRHDTLYIIVTFVIRSAGNNSTQNRKKVSPRFERPTRASTLSLSFSLSISL